MTFRIASSQEAEIIVWLKEVYKVGGVSEDILLRYLIAFISSQGKDIFDTL